MHTYYLTLTTYYLLHLCKEVLPGLAAWAPVRDAAHDDGGGGGGEREAKSKQESDSLTHQPHASSAANT